jgi:hypothetical protein
MVSGEYNACGTMAQYMRFIELVHERNVAQAFKNKSTIVMTTSIHFYDHTAHRYMHAVCDDLEMNYIGYFSAEMEKGSNPLLTCFVCDG